jgi:ubiquitin carboxyl-terminal hydrolase 5/13
MQGGSVERSIEWLFSHPDDMGDSDATAPAASAPSERKVLGSSSLPARYKLSSFISHKGPSVHSGHYVAHVATDKGWVLFNDEKVVKADSGEQAADKLSPFAYVYVFRRA